MENQDKLVIEEYITTDAPPDQLRWKMSFRDETAYFELESNSLWYVLRIMFTVWRSHRKEKPQRDAESV